MCRLFVSRQRVLVADIDGISFVATTRVVGHLLLCDISQTPQVACVSAIDHAAQDCLTTGREVDSADSSWFVVDVCELHSERSGLLHAAFGDAMQLC